MNLEQNMQENRMNLALKALEKLTDEDLSSLQMTMPWQMDSESVLEKDPDGFGNNSGNVDNREQLQLAIWDKFNTNPQVSTAVKGQVGRLTGNGFEVSSEIPKIQDVIDEIELDQRNRLYTMWPKFVGRSVIEGELFLALTVHDDSFIEIDFLDPSDITGGGEDGIIYHPTKATMPLFYFVSQSNPNNPEKRDPILVPSIFIARYPELLSKAKELPAYVDSYTKDSRSSKSKFKKTAGFNRFIVAWDKSFMTKRNISHLRTILEWLNHYENLKKYEIDHKKSAGSYLWVVTMEDPKTFRTWLALSDEERKKTGIMAKKTPGGTMVLPPGMKLEVMNPSLPNISESDTDIFHMITSGLNEPEDVTSGQSKGTFSSVKASRGPMSDRMMDESTYFERFLRHDFWGGIFYLKAMVNGFPTTFTQKVCIDFKSQEPVFKNATRRPELLIDISFPTSEVNDMEARARATLGVKHGDLNATLGIPRTEIAKKMGFGNYRKLRLQAATEEERYPELAVAVDQAAIPGQDPKAQQNPDAKPIVKPSSTIKRRTTDKAK
jgi:hypothetical protein